MANVFRYHVLGEKTRAAFTRFECFSAYGHTRRQTQSRVGSVQDLNRRPPEITRRRRFNHNYPNTTTQSFFKSRSFAKNRKILTHHNAEMLTN